MSTAESSQRTMVTRAAGPDTPIGRPIIAADILMGIFDNFTPVPDPPPPPPPPPPSDTDSDTRERPMSFTFGYNVYLKATDTGEVFTTNLIRTLVSASSAFAVVINNTRRLTNGLVELARAAKDIDNNVQHLANRVGRMEGNVKTLNKKIDDLDGKVANLETTTANLERSTNANFKFTKGRLDAIDGKITRVEKRLDNLEGEVANVSRRLGDLEITVADVSERLGTLEVTVDKLDKKVDMLDKKVDTLDQKVDDGFARLNKSIDEKFAAQMLEFKAMLSGDVRTLQATRPPLGHARPTGMPPASGPPPSPSATRPRENVTAQAASPRKMTRKYKSLSNLFNRKS